MKPFEVLGWLKQHTNFGECYHIHSVYKGAYNKSDGSPVEVELTIYEFKSIYSTGPQYTAVATSRDGKRATSNLENSIHDALAGLHWNDIEKF